MRTKMVPAVRVRVNGELLPGAASADLINVSVFEDVTAPDMFTITLLNWDMMRRQFTWSDRRLFALGASVDIEMGYGERLEQLMWGEVTGLEPEYNAAENPTITVRGYDKSHRLMRGRKTRSFKNMTDSAIAAEIAMGAKLQARATNSVVINGYVQQSNQTDMEFLEQRAQRIGFEVLVERGTLLFRPTNNAATPSVRLDRTDDLADVSLRLSSLVQASSLAVRGWDPALKQAIQARADTGDLTSRMRGAIAGPTAATAAFGDEQSVSVRNPVASTAEARKLAIGSLNTMALDYVTGTVTCDGRAEIAAGRTVQIDGLGRKFSGAYYVTSATHTYSPGSGGYATEFSIRRNAA
jgi:Bacteriophage probable baseplate hub protein